MNFNFPAQPPEAAVLDRKTPPTVYDLLGLFKGQKRITDDLVLKVLGNMPASAALTGLGLMDSLHVRAAELDGYIQGCIELLGSHLGGFDDTNAFVEIHERITKYMGDKDYFTSPMSIIWRSCAVGALIWAVRGEYALANLRPRAKDKPYVELMMVQPECSQPLPANQVHQGDLSPSLNMDWFAAGFAQAQAQAPFVDAELPGDQPHGSPLPQQGPYMSGGLSGFNISPSPQPNHQGSPDPSSGFSFSTPGTASGRSATPYSQYGPIPSFNSPPRSQPEQHSPLCNIASPAPSQSPFFNNDDGAYGSMGSFTPSPHHTPFLNQHHGLGHMPATPQSPANLHLSSGSPNPPKFNAPQWNTPARALSPVRSLSPLSNVFSNFHVGSTPGYRQSLSPMPSMASRMSPGQDHGYRQSVSPAPSMASHTHRPSPSVIATPSIASRLWASPSPLPDMPAQSQHQSPATAGQDLSPMSHLLFGHQDNTAHAQGSQNGSIDMQSPARSTHSERFGGVPFIDLTTSEQSPQHGPGSPVVDLTRAQPDFPMSDAPPVDDGQRPGQSVSAGLQQRNTGSSPGDGDSIFEGDGVEEYDWLVDDRETLREVLIVGGAVKRLPKTT
ncbi:hypothetical protein GE09DRAFT_1066971 [Coniochaeta sp. 2T2.1]|nr:hypothetical protein GE09DRAFT_1066971 [Coniochaeta sp. 2T2.1]